MIRLPDVDLPEETRASLGGFQEEVDGEPTYGEQVAAAKRLFGNRNRPDNRTFRVVRAKLGEMCAGARRCCYCEDSCADEVEHIRPKDLYPDFVFVWENYLYACGPCNGPKSNGFAVFETATGRETDVTRHRGDPVEPPPAGDPVLIDPRQEDPLEYMELDLLGTFRFNPSVEDGRPEFRRADYTIELLRLNERDMLPEARRNAFGSYRARLRDYRDRQREGAATYELDRLIEDLQNMPHPTVWAEMKRQRDLHPELARLFDDVPEALLW